jgi:hypothetical protein
LVSLIIYAKFLKERAVETTKLKGGENTIYRIKTYPSAVKAILSKGERARQTESSPEILGRINNNLVLT